MDDLEAKYSSDEYVIRKARESDYDGVMKISEDIFGGMDIIPTAFFDYINDPFRVFTVVEKRSTNEIVSTECSSNLSGLC